MPKLSSITVKTVGMQELRKQLKHLGDQKVQNKLMDNALAAGGRVISKEWIRRAPARSLKDVRVRRGKSAIRLLRRSKSGRKNTKISSVAIVSFFGPGYRLAHLFEYGTAPRRQETTGRYTGRMPMTPFARPGVDSVRSEVQSVMAKNLSRGINREAKKLGARFGNS